MIMNGLLKNLRQLRSPLQFVFGTVVVTVVEVVFTVYVMIDEELVEFGDVVVEV